MDLSASVGLRLTAEELPGAAGLLVAELATGERPDLHLAAGLLGYLQADFDPAVHHLEAAYLTYKRAGDRRRASLAATHLGRVHHDGLGNNAVASGWFARSLRLLEQDEDCLERGWAALGLVGCSYADADRLEADAALALGLARRLDDVDLECMALADAGLALVSRGRIDVGMVRLDEAMTMATNGECDNIFIGAQVCCCLITACERAGDLPRLEGWLTNVFTRSPMFRAPPNPTLLFSHCRKEYGSLLCHAGRWPEAEVALCQAVAASETLHFRVRAGARAALAGLRIDQGRLAEAAELLTGLELSPEAQLSLVRLHARRGDHDLTAAVARQAIRMLAGDVMRQAPLQAVLVQAELARGNHSGAAEAEAGLRAAAERVNQPQLRAMAALAAARVIAGRGEVNAAREQLDRGLRELPGDEWPLLAAELYLELARLLADGQNPQADRVAAIAEARRALVIFGRVRHQSAHDAQDLLHRLGDPTEAVPDRVRLLTAREREILRLIAQGLTNPEIAEQLVIAPKTAEHHVGNILRKLSLRNRSEAAVYAATLAPR